MFDRLIGNENIKTQIAAMIKKDMIPNSMLFNGPEGVGKFGFAVEMAKAALCFEKSACGQCPSCKALENGTHPDYLVISTNEKAIKVAGIESVFEFISTKASLGKRKILILDQAHKMNKEVQNKLLKTFESAHESINIILVTHLKDALLETVLSRMFQISFTKLNHEESRCVIRHFGRALSENEENKIIEMTGGIPARIFEYFNEREHFSIFSNAQMTLHSLLHDDIIKAVSKLSDLDDALITNQLDALIVLLRDILIYSTSRDSSVIINKSEIDDIIYLSTRFSIETIYSMIEKLEKAKAKIKANVNQRVVLGSTLISLQEDFNDSNRH